MQRDNSISSYYHYFKDLWADTKPLAVNFRTDNKGYVYDTGTNKIFACTDHEYSLLHNLLTMDTDEGLRRTRHSMSGDAFLRALDGVKTSVEKKNILKTKKADRFGASAHYGDLEAFISGHLHMIILELTERCNLRCSYCIYGPQFTQKRNHGTRDMSSDVAYKAINLLGRNSRFRKDVGITFYGGEPLLRFSLLKACVDHARHRLSGRDISFSLTTNATLVTQQIADYLADEGFGVHVSLDGPKNIHDKCRKDANGIGSYRRTISGLKILLDAYHDQKKKISLSMVYTPPYSEANIDLIAQLWDHCPWIPRDVEISFSYAHGSSMPQKQPEYRHWDSSLINWAKRSYTKSYNNNGTPHPIAAQFVIKKLAGLVQRPLMFEPDGKYNLNGCCIPAERKLFVSVDGKLHLCERIGKAPDIGNVKSGVDIERVKNTYIKEYEKKSLPICSGCWALRLCDTCYVHAYYDGEFNIDYKNEYCWAQRLIALECLKLYCTLLENNEFGLDYLMDLVIR